MNNVIIDNDPALGHETNSTMKKAVNSVLIPTLNSLPTGIRKYLKKSHKAGKEIIEHATTHKALDILYGHGSAKAKGNVVQNFFNSIWLSTNNAKAVRNRLKLVKREVREEIVRLANEGKEIRIASIASGSARAITESIVEASLGKDGISRLSATFVDKNPAAIEYSPKLAENLDFKDRLNWINDTAGSFFRSNVKNNKKFDIIEIVGLIDYFDVQKAIAMFSMYTSFRARRHDDNREY